MDDLTELVHTVSRALDDDNAIRTALDDIVTAYDACGDTHGHDRNCFVRKLKKAASYVSWEPKKLHG